jgi:hypothetical protein
MADDDDKKIIDMPTPMNVLADRVRAGHQRAERGSQEWVEGVLEMASAMHEARDHFQNDDRRFGIWTIENEIDFFNQDDRNALVNMGAHLELARIVLEETQRRSFQLIWREEMKPRLEGKIRRPEVRGVVIRMSRSAMRDDQSPTLTPERPEIAAQETEKVDPAIPQNAEPTPTPKLDLPRKEFRKRGRQAAFASLPDADLVNAHMLEKQARAEFGKFVRTPKGRPAWALLIESIETGLYGPPTRADSTTSMTVRVLLPWLPQRSFAGFHLKNPLTHKLVREVLFPMLRERPELRETPHLVEREFNARRRAIEEDARRKSKLDEHKAKIQAGAMAAGEQPIVAFGEPLWPPQRPDLTSPYSYKELCHACWFVGYFLGIARPGWKPTETAMAGRHLAKYIEPVQPGFVAAVRAIFNAYEDHPNGEQQFPPIPVNFGN